MVRIKVTLLIVMLLALPALAACSHTVTACHGQAYPLNEGKWQPTQQDMEVRS